MKLIKITENNIEYAIRIQNELFPDEDGRTNFEESLEADFDYDYYLLYDDETCVGIIGLYNFGEDKDSAWLGWFGIKKEFRRKGYGSEALKAFEEMAIEKGYRFARLYTGAENNDNPDDPVSEKYKMLIFSKSLSKEKLVPWYNRNIHLTGQIVKQEKYSSKNN